MNKIPVAKTIPFVYKSGNHIIEDEYFWLRDKKWPKVSDQEILNYLKEENSYADSTFFNALKKEKQILFEELKGRIKLTDKSEEIQKDEYYYYNRVEDKSDYPIYCRKLGKEGQEEVILNINELAKGKKYIDIGSISISPDHNLLAYSIDYKGDERYTIKIVDLKKQEYLEDIIDNSVGSIIWHQNKPGFFYTPADENWRATKVFFHLLGSKSDQLILQEDDLVYSFKLSISASKRFLLINSSGAQENQIYTIDFAKDELQPSLFTARRPNILYGVEHHINSFYILTNDTSNQFRLAITDLENTNLWQEYIPANPKAYLENFAITKNYLILNYKKEALPLIKVIDLVTKKEHLIKFPEEVYTANGYSTNFINDDIRIFYSSLKRPKTIYQYDYTQNSITPIKITEIPSGFDPDLYEVKRCWSDNGDIKIPVSIIYKKSLVNFDGSNPLYLYGYGSYGLGIEPSFRSSIISLINRGFIFAIAHIRGGDELGYKWYEAAKFLTKKRTFEDFIAVAKDLIARKYTSKGNIVIVGGSAGGMLIGNVINLYPELYKAAVAHVPFVDVLNTMLDKSLPLTPREYKEWGNPAESDEFFSYIQSYSPYDNIKKQDYPALFVTTSISDPRVGYFEPAKWVAKLRKNKTDKNLLLFKTNLDTGHAGASGRFDYLKEIADEYLFILKTFGINI